MMKNWSAKIARTLRIALVLGAAFSLTGCGPLLTLYASHEGFDRKDGKTVAPLKDDEIVQAMADKFGLMALFAHVSYRQDLKSKQERNSACKSTQHPENDDYGMPKSNETDGKWMRSYLPNACINESGLFYETYIYKNGTSPIEEAVISFRGTENTVGQLLKDWTTNASAAFGIQPKQYELASNYLPDLIIALKSQNPDIKIYAVGHSLGGGLAQQAGYQFRDIRKVFTFNTSPVTNWTYLRFRGKVENEYPTIYRIYHGGEFLEKLRFFTTSFTSTSFRRYDLGIQFQPRSNIGGHSMEILACGFAALIVSDTTNQHNQKDAAHYYGRKFAREEIFGKNKICSPGYKDMINETNIDFIKAKRD